MVQIENTPDHDGATAEGHLLDCHVNKTFPMMPPDMQLIIVVVECRAQLVAEEDLPIADDSTSRDACRMCSVPLCVHASGMVVLLGGRNGGSQHAGGS